MAPREVGLRSSGTCTCQNAEGVPGRSWVCVSHSAEIWMSSSNVLSTDYSGRKKEVIRGEILSRVLG